MPAPRSHVRQSHGLGHAFSVPLWDMPNKLFHVKQCRSGELIVSRETLAIIPAD